jgi:hypothetical protein
MNKVIYKGTNIMLVIFCHQKCGDYCKMKMFTFSVIRQVESGQRSRFSDCLWALWSMVRSSNPGRFKNFLHVVQTGSGAHRASYPMDTGAISSWESAEAWRWPFTSNYCRGQENMDLYIHSPTRLHGVVLNYLRTETTLTLHYTSTNTEWPDQNAMEGTFNKGLGK